MQRRTFLTLFITLVSLLAFAGCSSSEGDSHITANGEDKVFALKGPLEEKILGNKDAKVTIVEYSSLTCPHCANFHTKILPELKKKYIDTGKAMYVLREFPLDDRAAAAAMLGRCLANPEGYFDFIDVLYANQQTWAYADGDFVEKLLGFARKVGMSEKDFKACLSNKELFANVKKVRSIAQKNFNITATPTFFINGKKLDGINVVDFDKAIEPLLKAETK